MGSAPVESIVRVWACVVLLGCGATPEPETPANGEVSFTESSHQLPPPPPPAEKMVETGPFYEPDADGYPVPILRSDAPNMKYANTEASACEKELARRSVPFARAPAMRDVYAPMKLTGAMHGVSFRGGGGANEIFDCRLLLALDDFTQVLAKHDITDALYSSAYRSQAQNGCTAKYAGLQHCGALALDIHFFKKKDGSMLSVEKDFHGKIGMSTCYPTSAPNPRTPNATALWTIECEAASAAMFNVILSPNYNAAHFNHMHVEVTPDAEWMLIR